MNRFRVWGLSAALVAGVGGLVVAADPNMQPGQTTLSQKIADLFAPQPAKLPAASAQAAPLTITAPLTPEVLVKCLEAETKAYSRRISVCDQLRQVANEKGDAALGRQVDELERQASAIYDARTAALGLPKIKTPAFESTRVIPLEEPLAPQAAANRLIAPASPVPVETTAAIREVNP